MIYLFYFSLSNVCWSILYSLVCRYGVCHAYSAALARSTYFIDSRLTAALYLSLRNLRWSGRILRVFIVFRIYTKSSSLNLRYCFENCISELINNYCCKLIQLIKFLFDHFISCAGLLMQRENAKFLFTYLFDLLQLDR